MSPGQGEPAHEHADLRFVLATWRPDEAVAESGDAPLRWLTVAEAKALVGEDNLQETLRRVGPLLAAGPSGGAAPVALAAIDAAAAALLATAEGLTGEQVHAPSLLPGWSRGHVLTHVARNADALARLLRTARTGEDQPAYASAQARVAAIDEGAGRGPAELAADLSASAAAWRAEAAMLPDSARFTLVSVLGDAFPAAQVLTRRLHETVLHHTDLGAGFGPADWPAAYADLDLPPNMAAQRADWSGQDPSGPGA
jgi:maleylpyruvate isomerase